MRKCLTGRAPALRVVFPAVLCAVFCVLTRPVHVLRITGDHPQNHGILAVVRTAPGKRIAVSYRHSMYGVEQVEEFEVEADRRFRLLQVSFGSLAAALYYDPLPPARMTRHGDIWVALDGLARYDKLRYRVSPGTQHTLRLNDQSLDLSGWAVEAGVPIEIRAERMPLIVYAFVACTELVSGDNQRR